MRFRLVTPAQIAAAQKTARKDKYKSVVTGFIIDTFDPKEGLTFLDFGAGKFVQTDILREAGFNVTPYDFGMSKPKGRFDVVFASNVINVQSSIPMLENTLMEIAQFAKGKIILNYPSDPRKMEKEMTNREMQNFIASFYHRPIEKIKYRSSFVWVI